jgi:hypothetical protein
LALLHHVEVSLVLDEFCEFQIGPRLKNLAHWVKNDTDPSWARIVLRIVLAWTRGDQLAQAPVLEIEPIVDLNLFDFFCVFENHCLHAISSIQNYIPDSLLKMGRVTALTRTTRI